MTFEAKPPALEKSVVAAEQKEAGENELERYSPRQIEGDRLLQKIVSELPAPSKKNAADPELRFGSIGLVFCLDRDEKYYAPDGSYTGTLIPWINRPGANGSKKPELSMNVPSLKKAIKRILNPGTRAVCEMHLGNILALFDEEKTEMEQDRVARLKDSVPAIEEFEALLDAFEKTHDLAALHAIETEEEALTSEARAAANRDRSAIRNALTALGEETNADISTKDALYEKYLKLARAVGTINRGKVDHTR